MRSGEAQGDPGHGFAREHVPLDFDEPVRLREPQPVRVGREDHGLDHIGAELPRPLQPASLENLAEALPPVLGQHPGE